MSIKRRLRKNSPSQASDSDTATASGQGKTDPALTPGASSTRVPLRRRVSESSCYPVDSLGAILGPAARALADATQAPLALCGHSLLAAATLAVQPFANALIDGRSYPISNYFISVGATGERKSAVDLECLRLHLARQKANEVGFADAEAAFKVNLEIYKRRKSAALRDTTDEALVLSRLQALGNPPRKPLLPMILMQEPSYVGLVQALDQGQPSLGIFADEGGRLLKGAGMRGDNIVAMATGLSELWGSGTVTRVRAKEAPIVLRDRRLCVHLMAQPRVVAAFYEHGCLHDQGLLSRFLLVWPESTVGSREYRPVDLSKDTAMTAYWERIRTILATPMSLAEGTRNELAPRLLGLSTGAKRLWIEFHDDLESQMAIGEPLAALRPFVNKLPEHLLRVSCVLTLVDDFEAQEVSEAKMQAAIELMTFYLGEIIRIREFGVQDRDLDLAEILYAWALARGEHIDLPSIYQLGPAPIRDKQTAKRIVKILEDHRWLIEVPGGMAIDGQFRREVWRVVK